MIKRTHSSSGGPRFRSEHLREEISGLQTLQVDVVPSSTFHKHYAHVQELTLVQIIKNERKKYLNERRKVSVCMGSE